MNAKERGRRRFRKEGAGLAGMAVGAIRSASGQTPGSDILESSSKESYKDFYAYGGRSRFENSVRIAGAYNRAPARFRVFPGLRTPLQDSIGIITPASLHFVNSHGYNPPDIEPRQHRLLIHGLVDRPLIFTMDELKRLPSLVRNHFIECNANSGPPSRGERQDLPTIQHRHGFISCSQWTGVPLSVPLQMVGVQKGAS